MEKQIKISYIFFGLVIFSFLAHNAIFAIYNVEEAFFFILVFVSILGFILSVIWNTISYLKTGKPKDLWKVGWLGFFGLFGLLNSPGLFGLFGLYGFFGAKSWKKKS